MGGGQFFAKQPLGADLEQARQAGHFPEAWHSSFLPAPREENQNECKAGVLFKCPQDLGDLSFQLMSYRTSGIGAKGALNWKVKDNFH